MAGRGRGLWGSLTAPTLPAIVPAALVLASLPLLRPGILGEMAALAGCALALAAGGAALLRRERVPARPVPAVPVLVGFLALAYLWMVGHGAMVFAPGRINGLFQDVVLTVGSLVAFALVLADPRARRAVVRGVVVVTVVVCAGWVVTAMIWAVAGIGAAQIGTVPVGTYEPQPVYFPFTITYSTFDVFGQAVPRLNGFGRESGWMAMFCAASWFLADAAGYRARWVKVLLLAGLVGTLSTAGFGVFVVVLALDLFLRPRGGIALTGFVRQVGGLVAIAAAGWLAVAAPVLGLNAKQTTNETSLAERQDAAAAGIRALTESPLGGLGSEKQAGINLVSDIAVNGLPFVLLVSLTILVPPLLAPGRGAAPLGRAVPVALVVFLTLLLSQPAAASTWAFALVAVACAAEGLTDAERAAPGSPLLARWHRRWAGPSVPSSPSSPSSPDPDPVTPPLARAHAAPGGDRP
ncbi:hypothetical protein ACQPX6_25500 [Actinomycetospora sp. CA-101289]|uniref:hypothetical protein n=1 Tax=Actinomycetospora sp. CA-101289 TaxID=3239893 RepID=UPI003D9545A0